MDDLLSPKNQGEVNDKLHQKGMVMATLASHYKQPIEYFLDMGRDDPMLKAMIDVALKERGKE